MVFGARGVRIWDQTGEAKQLYIFLLHINIWLIYCIILTNCLLTCNIDSELNSNKSSSHITDNCELEPIKFGKKKIKKVLIQ